MTHRLNSHGGTTRVIHGTKEVVDAEVAFFYSIKKKADTYMNYTRPPLAIGLDPVRNAFLDAKSRGVHLRYLTEITKDNIVYCKELLKLVDELRHLDGIKGNFMVSETEYVAPLILFEHGQIATQAIYSNTKEIVGQQQHIFDNFWSKGISAGNKIKEIEEGAEPEFHEVITNEDVANKILLELSRSVKKEALFILPTDNAMRRADSLGVIDCLINASQAGAVIKIICPLSERNSQILSKISDEAPSIQILKGSTSPAAGVLIVDGMKFSRTELGEPSNKDTNIQSSRFTVYSNSRPTVELFRSIFGLLWNERTLNEQLKITESMQRDFINIAAHELRTPIQPILGLSQILSIKLVNTEYSEPLNIIVKNALKLQRLTEDILDVQKIESKTMNLKKERFHLNKLILDIVGEYRNQLRDKDDHVEIKANVANKDIPLFIEADRYRITQVITNLLSNAVKFTKKGRILICLQQKKGNNPPEVLVSVMDTGQGIDPHILPRIFSRFVSKSYQGTGLGLYISKGIVEAHGGKIRGKNNDDGKGATFSFSLPSTH
ncbi:MAG: HAMP domain-containing histidine kinase [Thermoproteota archaeon]|nr:HAMP domain-containing histidine kinase [Thermoproteota archaeon]